MTAYTLSDATRKKYEAVSTATLCTALFKRGLRNQFLQDVRPVAPKAKNMPWPKESRPVMPSTKS